MVTLSFSAEWRWADDTAEFTMDKEAHFVGSAGAYFFSDTKTIPKWNLLDILFI